MQSAGCARSDDVANRIAHLPSSNDLAQIMGLESECVKCEDASLTQALQRCTLEPAKGMRPVPLPSSAQLTDVTRHKPTGLVQPVQLHVENGAYMERQSVQFQIHSAATAIIASMLSPTPSSPAVQVFASELLRTASPQTAMNYHAHHSGTPLGDTAYIRLHQWGWMPMWTMNPKASSAPKLLGWQDHDMLHRVFLWPIGTPAAQVPILAVPELPPGVIQASQQAAAAARARRDLMQSEWRERFALDQPIAQRTERPGQLSRASNVAGVRGCKRA